MTRAKLRTGARLGGIASALLIAGCATNAVIFSTATRLGIEIATTDQAPGAKIGYQRFEGTTMPLRDPQSGTVLTEAYPVVAAFGYSTGGLIPGAGNEPMGTRVKQVFATGDAAENATAPTAVLNAFNADAPTVGISPIEARKLAAKLLATLRSVPAEKQSQVFTILTEELGANVTNMGEARDAVQDAGAGLGKGAAGLTRARDRIDTLLGKG